MIPAGVFVAIGVLIEIIAVGQFFTERTTVNPLTPGKANKLVVSGLYKYSRNPMYVGLLFVLIGFAVWLGNPVNLLVLSIFFFAITELQIKPEERALSEKFGEEFDAYRRRVRRWL